MLSLGVLCWACCDLTRVFDKSVVMVVIGDRDTGSSASEMTPEERREMQRKEEALHASSLRIPRRYVSFLLFG